MRRDLTRFWLSTVLGILFAGAATAVQAQDAPAGPPAPVPAPAPPGPVMFKVTPPAWDLGEVEQGRIYTMSFRIESDDPQFSTSIVQSSNPFLGTQLVRLSDRDRATWQLTCQFNIANLSGNLEEFVMLATSDKASPLFKIPVRCRIKAAAPGEAVDGLFFYSTRVGAIPSIVERLAAVEKKRSLKLPSLYTGEEANMIKKLQTEAQFNIQPGQGTQIEFFCAGRTFFNAPQVDLAVKALESEEKDWQKAVQAAFEEIRKAIAAQQNPGGGQAQPLAAPPNGGGDPAPVPAPGNVSSSPNFVNEVKSIGAPGPNTGAPPRPPEPTPSPAVTQPLPPPAPVSVPAGIVHTSQPADASPPGSPLLGVGLVVVILVLLYQTVLLKELIGRMGK
ncbi:MAG: hypothetical protein HYY93_04745 [Planctomycetes bacterium]|nr:hypothetical protein [Planctomycetota bacterium]